MITPTVVATIALQGAATGVSCELALRYIFKKGDKNLRIRIAKVLLGLFMAIKTIVFISFNSNQGKNCNVIGRMADLFYHLAMTAGNYVLLGRVQSVIPMHWRKRSTVIHTIATIARLLIGIVDVVLVKINVLEDGTCEYIDEKFWGPVYTLYDTVIDIYVTFMISIILIRHIKSLESDKIKINTTLYMSVICQNVIRTFFLTIVNLLSTIFIVLKILAPILILLWPIINIFFVILVGYDSDVTKAIGKLPYWGPLSNILSTVDLPHIPASRSGHFVSTPVPLEHESQTQRAYHNDDLFNHSNMNLPGAEWEHKPSPFTHFHTEDRSNGPSTPNGISNN